MKTTKRLLSLASIVVFSAFLSGCWESHEVTFYEPGVYQGAADSLNSDTAALESRMQGQLDR